MNHQSVCILDYGSGNVGSVYNLVSANCPNTEISNKRSVIEQSSHLILPGVGAFGAAMEKIKKTIPLDTLEKEVKKGKPFLGICVGMQVLATKGLEFGEHEGLNWIPGEVNKLDTAGLPLPHIGWNDIQIVSKHPILDTLEQIPDFYFVHSFAFYPKEKECIRASTHYGEEFVSVISKDNIAGVQFHPEKSQRAGSRLIQNFLRMA